MHGCLGKRCRLLLQVRRELLDNLRPHALVAQRSAQQHELRIGTAIEHPSRHLDACLHRLEQTPEADVSHARRQPALHRLTEHAVHGATLRRTERAERRRAQTKTLLQVLLEVWVGGGDGQRSNVRIRGACCGSLYDDDGLIKGMGAPDERTSGTGVVVLLARPFGGGVDTCLNIALCWRGASRLQGGAWHHGAQFDSEVHVQSAGGTVAQPLFRDWRNQRGCLGWRRRSLENDYSWPHAFYSLIDQTSLVGPDRRTIHVAEVPVQR